MKYIAIVAVIVLAFFGFTFSARAATILFPTGGGTGKGTFTTGLLGASGINPFFTQATTTASCSGSASCTPFTVIGSSPITISATGGTGGTGNVATSSTETATFIPFWTSTGATPATLSGGDSGFIWNNTAKRLTFTYGSTTAISATTANTDLLRANTSAGTVVQAANGTQVSIMGAGNTANALFYGGVNIDGATRLATSLTGLLKATSGAVTAATAGTDYEAPLTFTYPLVDTANTISLAFGTTTTNTWSNLQTFTSGIATAASSTVGGAFNVSGNSWFGGNVGIGTTSPLAKLNVQNSSDASSAFLVSGSSKGVRIGTVADSGLIEGVDYSGFGSYQPLTIGGSDVRFTTSGTERLRVTGAGNVGIGTTTPAQALSVQGNGLFSGDLNIANFVAAGTASITGAVTAKSYNINAIGAAVGNGLYAPLGNTIALTTNTVERLRIDSTGNVGIGTTTPSTSFAVQGNALFSGNLSLANLTATGTIQAATLTLTNALAGSYGGTGSTTLSGILAGNGTSGVKTAVIGSGLSWDGTTLAATGGSSASSTLLADVNTWSGANTYGAGLLRSTSPRITTSILDANGATILGFTPVASASNYVTVTNSNGGTPGISSNSGAVPLSLTGGGGVLTLTGDGTGKNGLTLNMVGSAAPVISPTQSNTSLVINSNGSGSIQLNGSSGKVGVGTTSPAAILSVGAPAGTAPLMIGSTTKTLAQIDTNGKLQVLDAGTSYNGVVTSLRQLIFAPATTTTWTGTTSGPYIKKAVIPYAATIRQIICETDTGTLGIDLYHTSTHLAYLNASTTKGTFKFTSNNTVTAGETLYMVAGTPASTPTSVTCSVGITETP